MSVDSANRKARRPKYRAFAVLRFSAWLLALAVFAAGGRAEGQTEGEKLKAVVFMHYDLSASAESAPYREVLFGAMEKRLIAEGFEVIPRQELQANPVYASLAGGAEVSGETLLSAAKSIGADTAAAGIYGIDGRRLFIQIKLYDVRTGKVVAAAMEYGLAGLAGYNLVGEMTDNISPEIQAYIKGRDPNEPLTYESIEGLVLRSVDEGMEVAFESGSPVGRVTEGVLRPPYVPFLVGSTFQIEKNKPGYHPGTEEITVGEGINDITLRPLDRKFRNEASLYWTNGQTLGAGIGYRYYPNPDYFFAGADYQFYVQHDFLENSSPVLHNEFSFTVGGYLFSTYRSKLRIGYSAGLGVIITSFTAPDLPVYTDYYLNFANLFIDFNLRPWTFFINAYGKYALGQGNNLLGSEMLGGNIGPTMSLGVRKKW